MIIRSKRTGKFTVINNELINNPDLDWKDIGLMAYLLSRPEKWEVSVAYLSKQKKFGIDDVLSIVNNLIAAGYITQVDVCNEVRK